MKNLLVFLLLLAGIAPPTFASGNKMHTKITQKPRIDYRLSDDSLLKKPDIYVFHVKIAIDRKSYDHFGKKYFVNNIKQQFIEVNKRWNAGPDGKQIFDHKYYYRPDLRDILIYEGTSVTAGEKCVPRMDRNKFFLLVSYDGFRGDFPDESGGGCSEYRDTTGISTILVTGGDASLPGGYDKLFDKWTNRAIAHEFGHFRGVTDLYTDIVDPQNNPVNHEGYQPRTCNMNNCYSDVNVWSDYAISCINKAGNKRLKNQWNKFFVDLFPANLTISVKKDGTPVKDAIVRFYGVPAHEKRIVTPEVYVYNSDTNGQVILPDVKKLFMTVTPENKDWGRWFNFLLEVEHNGEKKYQWLPDYEVQNITFSGKKTFEVTFNL